MALRDQIPEDLKTDDRIGHLNMQLVHHFANYPDADGS